MDDRDKRIAALEALLRDAPYELGAFNEWIIRRDAILVPPSDPDAGAKEVQAIWGGAGGYLEGYRAVAAWADQRVAAAERRGRIAGLREAHAEACVSSSSERTTRVLWELIAKAGADDAA